MPPLVVGTSPFEGSETQLLPDGAVASILTCVYTGEPGVGPIAGAAFRGSLAHELAAALGERPPAADDSGCAVELLGRSRFTLVRYAGGRVVSLLLDTHCGVVTNGSFSANADASLASRLMSPMLTSSTGTPNAPKCPQRPIPQVRTEADPPLMEPAPFEGSDRGLLPKAVVSSIQSCFHDGTALVAVGPTLLDAEARAMASKLNELQPASPEECEPIGLDLASVFVHYSNGSVVRVRFDRTCRWLHNGPIAAGAYTAIVDQSIEALVQPLVPPSSMCLPSEPFVDRLSTSADQPQRLLPDGEAVSVETCFYGAGGVFVSTGATFQGSAAQAMARTINELPPAVANRLCTLVGYTRWAVVFVRYADGRVRRLTHDANCGDLSSGAFTAATDHSLSPLLAPLRSTPTNLNCRRQ